MLKVTEIDESIISYDYPTPTVYIDGGYINNDNYTIFYHIKDDFNYWYTDKYVIDNLHLSMSCNDFTHIESLSSLISRNEIIDGKLHGRADFKVSGNDITVSALCFNNLVKGVQVSEKILENGKIAANVNVPDASSFNYLNKFKDISLLNVEQLNSASFSELTSSGQPFVFSQLLVSENTSKNASFAFIFNLEEYLENNSATYKVLKKYEDYRTLILQNSYILKDSIKFYKKNISREDSEYVYIDNKSHILKMSDGVNDNKFIITSADKNEYTYIKEKYSVKVDLEIVDFSMSLLTNDILKKIKKCISFLQDYKDLFLSINKNSLIVDKNKYIFENMYEDKVQNMRYIIEDISEIFSFYNKKTKEEYIKFFVSSLHPLYTDIFLLEKILESANLIQTYLYSLTNDVNYYESENDITYELEKNIDQNNQFQLYKTINNDSVSEKKLSNLSRNLSHEFSTIDLDGKKTYNEIDYNYDLNFGLEVISIDPYEYRQKEKIESIKILTIAEKNARKILETSKFFYSPTVSNINVDHFSLSFIDLGLNSYDLTTFDVDNSSKYNEIFIMSNEYNKGQVMFNKVENLYFGVLDKNVYIKSIAARSNESINNLEKATIFDSNNDSKDGSIKYISETGVQFFYYFLDTNKFLEIPERIPQYYTLYRNDSFKNSSLVITEDDRKNPESKPKLIVCYNAFFKDKIAFSGDNYEIWEIEEALVNELFTKKLKLFNKYYILEKKKNVAPVEQEAAVYKFVDELVSTFKPSDINRQTSAFQNTIIREEF